MDQATVVLRQAIPEDAGILSHWDTLPHVIACAPNDDIDWVHALSMTVSWQEFLIAELDSQPIGALQIIDPKEEETHYWGEIAPGLRAIDIWIGEEKLLGKGYGTQMMHQAIERCFSQPDVTAIIIDPLLTNTRAINFYRKLGFKDWYTGNFEEDVCLVMRMERRDSIKFTVM